MVWTARQIGLRKWLESNAPTLAPVYLAAVQMVSDRSFPGRVWFVAHVLLIGVVASGCYEYPAEPIEIHNATDARITVYRVIPGREPPVYSVLEPGAHDADRNQCIDPDLEARLDDGTPVAYRSGPLCQGDPNWVITQAGALAP